MSNSEKKNTVFQVCNQALGMFRYQPKPEYIANLAVKLEEEHYTPQMVKYMFDQAMRLHDQYPSLSQLLDIAMHYQVRKKFSPTALPSATNTEEPKQEPITPWPKMLELFFTQEKNPLMSNGNAFLRKLLKLSDEELEELRQCWDTKDYLNEKATKIIDKRFRESAVDEIVVAITKKP